MLRIVFPIVFTSFLEHVVNASSFESFLMEVRIVSEAGALTDSETFFILLEQWITLIRRSSTP